MPWSPPGGGAKKSKIRKNSKAPKKSKAWTEYATWDELLGNEKAHEAYWKDVTSVLNSLDLDWSGVRATLADKIYDDREWAGRINLVGGRPEVVELVSSPHAVGEGPLPRGAGAMVPREVVEALAAKPALFMFHTHPGEDGSAVLPSPIDFAGAMHTAFTARFAADLVVSPYGVFMYTPSPRFRGEVWGEGPSAKTPKEAYLVLIRKIADLLGALEGTPSWNSPWSLDEYARTLRQYGVDYVVFPTDKYARWNFRGGLTTPILGHETLLEYHQQIQKLEEEVEHEREDRSEADERDGASRPRGPKRGPKRGR